MRCTLLTFLILVAGCTGISNLRMNEELTNLYATKIDAGKTNDVILQETVMAAFASLAKRAEAQAKKAKTTDDAVSFYRIAATAAWQGKSSKVKQLSDSGWEKCQQQGFDPMRRDCIMLLLIPDLAATDELTAKLDNSKRRINAELNKPADQRSAEIIQEIGQTSATLFTRLDSRFAMLVSSREKFSSASLPPGLVQQINKNQDFIFCRMREANAVLLRALGSGEPKFKANQTRLEKIRLTHDPNNDINCAA